MLETKFNKRFLNTLIWANIRVDFVTRICLFVIGGKKIGVFLVTYHKHKA